MGSNITGREHDQDVLNNTEDYERILADIDASVAACDLNGSCQDIKAKVNEINNVTGVKEYIGEISLSNVEDLFSTIGDSISSLKEYLVNNYNDIKAYDESSWWEKAANTLFMGACKLGEGVLGAFENIGDGCISLIGAGLGVFGVPTDWAEEAVKLEWSHDAFKGYYESDAAKKSAFTEDSMIAGGIQVVGTAATYIGLAAATAGVGSAIGIGGTAVGSTLGTVASGTTWASTGLAFLGGVGSGTESSLIQGKDFYAAFGDGMFEGVKDGAIAFAAGKIGEKIQSGKMTDADKANIADAKQAVVDQKQVVKEAKEAVKTASTKAEKEVAKNTLKAEKTLLKADRLNLSDTKAAAGLQGYNDPLSEKMYKSGKNVGETLKTGGIKAVAKESGQAAKDLASKSLQGMKKLGTNTLNAAKNIKAAPSAITTAVKAAPSAITTAVKAVPSTITTAVKAAPAAIKAAAPAIPGVAAQTINAASNTSLNNQGLATLKTQATNASIKSIPDVQIKYDPTKLPTIKTDDGTSPTNPTTPSDTTKNTPKTDGTTDKKGNTGNTGYQGYNENTGNTGYQGYNQNTGNPGYQGINQNTGNTITPQKVSEKKIDVPTSTVKPGSNVETPKVETKEQKVEVPTPTYVNPTNEPASTPSTSSYNNPGASAVVSKPVNDNVTYHTGGGYSEDGFYSSNSSSIDGSIDSATLDTDIGALSPLEDSLLETTTSIEDIVKNNKYTKIPTSSKPITTTSSSSGSGSVIPIAAGLSAAAAAGIGAKAYMDRKKNNDVDDDDEDDDFETSEWSGDESSMDTDYSTSQDQMILDDEDDYSYQEDSGEKYGARTNEELADMQ